LRDAPHWRGYNDARDEHALRALAVRAAALMAMLSARSALT
jgi:hypothetical protein